ncbi:unnamed protein product [Toxocara canis]|uniref:CCDC50_N domain-containing protein n=1 Tax=Toxocara canis TaxID=6265 RepID=A0A183V098_TOXCA|nr:unnamed protein product [Toxocara canis]
MALMCFREPPKLRGFGRRPLKGFIVTQDTPDAPAPSFVMIVGSLQKISVASRLRTYEDFNLASRLQDEEFGHHYALNRSERRRMGNDLRHSRRVQAIEDHIAACNRAHENSRIAQTDEALARRLQLEFEREESLKRETQTRLDAEFARRLQLDEEIQRQQAARARVEVEDERLAWQLQHQFDADQRTGAARRTEASTKKVLPPLASVTPKIRIGMASYIGPSLVASLGEWRSPARRLRSNSERNVDPQWCDRIDERSQNELVSYISLLIVFMELIVTSV